LKEFSPSSKCTSCSQVSTAAHEELPLPYIPNFSVVAAPFNTPGHQILGLLPKSEQITSKMLWVDDIQTPEVFQLVLAKHDQVLTKSFQPLVVIFKSEPLPINARILSYDLPRLRAPGGFFNPINSHLLAIPFNFQQFSSASYLCLGLISNFHPFSYSLATQTPIVKSQTSQSSSGSPVIELQQMPVRPIPAAQHLPRPAAVDFVTPSSPLPLVRSDESILIRSLQRFAETQPNTPLFKTPENFDLSLLLPDDYMNSLNDSHPIGLVPKSMALEQPNFLPMSVPSNADHTLTPWTDFQVVASMNSSIPQFFRPLIYMKTLDIDSQIDSFNNGVKLPIWLIVNEMGREQQQYQAVLIRNPYEPMPDSPYFVLCMTPLPEAISSSSTVKTPLSTDVLDSNPAIHPRVIATSTSKPFIDAETTKSSIAAVKTSEPAEDRERRIETIPTTPIVSQSNQVRGKMLGSKPLPSKKSWKNRLSYNMEPSVKVVKREPSSTTSRSILSYFGI
jgi:hypothetical protein